MRDLYCSPGGGFVNVSLDIESCCVAKMVYFADSGDWYRLARYICDLNESTYCQTGPFHPHGIRCEKADGSAHTLGRWLCTALHLDTDNMLRRRKCIVVESRLLFGIEFG